MIIITVETKKQKMTRIFFPENMSKNPREFLESRRNELIMHSVMFVNTTKHKKLCYNSLHPCGCFP